MKVEWDKARQKARDLIKQYQVSEPPVDVFDIAANEGIQIVFFNPNEATDKVSGLLEKDTKKIYLNATESPKRQAFTLAHELAHYFLNHKPNEYGVYRRDAVYSSKPPKEKEADMFAAELLMPAKLIEEAKKKYHLKDSDIAILASLFAVSDSAMRFRLKSLKNGHAQNFQSQ